VNAYLDAATDVVRDRFGLQGILFFYDNLEKVSNPSIQVDKALIRRASIHQAIRCTAIYTIPFGLLLSPEESGLPADAFTVLTVPMVAFRKAPWVPERDPDGMPEHARVFGRIIERRVDVDAVFASPGILSRIVTMSGGCPRDLLRITGIASEFAGRGQVTDEVLEAAFRSARSVHLRPVKSGDFEILARVHRTGRIENTRDDFRLLYHRLMVQYNDDEWFDAHPLVREDPRFRDALDRLDAAGSGRPDRG
jgi:hypothetical protein